MSALYYVHPLFQLLTGMRGKNCAVQPARKELRSATCAVRTAQCNFSSTWEHTLGFHRSLGISRLSTAAPGLWGLLSRWEKPVSETEIKIFLGSKARLVRNNLTDICEPTVLDNVGSLTSHSPTALHGLLRG
jgi:hypothetical protein